MEMRSDYTLVVEDSLNGFNDAFIDDRKMQIMVSPAIFSLLQDSDSRETILRQISGYHLDAFNLKERKMNLKELGRW